MVLQEPPVLERVDGDWQQDDDAEEGDPAQGALQVGLFYLLALEAEMGAGVGGRGSEGLWVQGMWRTRGPRARGVGSMVPGDGKGRTSGKGSPE